MEACLYEPYKDTRVRCYLCNHRCIIADADRGICGVRENHGGVLHTLVYGKLIASHVDPIEKKPFYHFFPGSLAYSIATVGCNFSCRFCQNSEISRMPADRNGKIAGTAVSPESVVEHALDAGCKSIAYTYTEPTVYFEFALDTARLAREKGLYNVFVTNGYMTREALDMIRPYLDAANVDLKAFRNEFYRDVCGASLDPVCRTLVSMKSMNIHVEITTLLIPGMNDDAAALSDMAAFIVSELGADTPWHISRFHPTYRMTDRSPTPLTSLISARDTGLQAGLRYVYTGNVPGEQSENTFCWRCGKRLIDRWGFTVRSSHIENSRCTYCGARIDGHFN